MKMTFVIPKLPLLHKSLKELQKGPTVQEILISLKGSGLKSQVQINQIKYQNGLLE